MSNGTFDAAAEHAAALAAARRDPAWQRDVRRLAARGVAWAVEEEDDRDYDD